MKLTLTQLDSLLLSQGIMTQFDTDTGSIFAKDTHLGETVYSNKYTANFSDLILRALARKQEEAIKAAINDLDKATGGPFGGAMKPVDISPAAPEEEAGQTTLFPKYPKELHEGDVVELFPNPDGVYKTVDEVIAGGPSLGSFRLLKMLQEETEIGEDGKGLVLQTWSMVDDNDDEHVYRYTIIVDVVDMKNEGDERDHEG